MWIRRRELLRMMTFLAKKTARDVGIIKCYRDKRQNAGFGSMINEFTPGYVDKFLSCQLIFIY